MESVPKSVELYYEIVAQKIENTDMPYHFIKNHYPNRTCSQYGNSDEHILKMALEVILLHITIVQLRRGFQISGEVSIT